MHLMNLSWSGAKTPSVMIIRSKVLELTLEELELKMWMGISNLMTISSFWATF